MRERDGAGMRENTSARHDGRDAREMTTRTKSKPRQLLTRRVGDLARRLGLVTVPHRKVELSHQALDEHLRTTLELLQMNEFHVARYRLQDLLHYPELVPPESEDVLIGVIRANLRYRNFFSGRCHPFCFPSLIPQEWHALGPIVPLHFEEIHEGLCFRAMSKRHSFFEQQTRVIHFRKK